ncbi:MAG: type II toxin-antitoxin system VapC family toxin [Verrucomicrobiales bacterium]|nr:type II toxin-antitoxin system VapC family toxin [Verrucomicrobiales bacterium]
MIIPDVNLLVYAYNAEAPFHLESKAWWEGAVNGSERIGIPWIVSTGFIRLVTHPRVLANPVSPDLAVRWVESWLEYDHISPVNPSHEHLKILKQCLANAGVGANLVTDAHIAALAIEYQSKVYSNDNDFSRFSDLNWVNPL